MHRFNVNGFTECMAALAKNCIQTPISNECSIKMIWLDRSWEGFDYINVSQTLPEINSVMAMD